MSEVTKKNITVEPRDDVFRALLQAASEQVSVAYVVVRNETELTDRATDCLSRLKPNLLSEEVVRQWPGTRLLAGEARLLTYRMSPALVEVIKAFSAGLYDWVAPALPEDLGFRRADGSLWLASVAHERDAWLELEALEWERLKALCPAFPLIVD